MPVVHHVLFMKTFASFSCAGKTRLLSESVMGNTHYLGLFTWSQWFNNGWAPGTISSAQSLSRVRFFADCSTPGLPVHHHLLESTQTHVHRVGDAIQLSHPLSSPSPPAFNLPQHQDHFKWVSSLHQVAKVLELLLQHQSFQWIFKTDLL